MGLAHGQYAADLADRHAALAHGDDHLLARPRGVARLQLGQRSVGIQAEDVDAAGEPRDARDADAVVDQRAQLFVFLTRLRFGAADDRHDAGKDADVFRPAPIVRHARAHVVAEILAFLDGGLGREHHVGGAGGKLHADVRGARLRHDRAALRRACYVERPAHREVLSLVAEDVHLVEVEPDAALLVAQKGIVLPAVPQTDDDVVELGGAVVAHAVLEMGVAAEIHRLVLGLRGDEVPAGAPAADVVDGEETARDVVGLVVGSRAGRHQADMAGDHGKGCNRAHRFDMHLPAVLRPERLAAIDRGAAGDGDAVLEEHAVELAALGHARHVGEVTEVEICFADRVGMTPSCRVTARNAEEGAETQLAPGHRHWVTVMRTVRKSCS